MPTGWHQLDYPSINDVYFTLLVHLLRVCSFSQEYGCWLCSQYEECLKRWDRLCNMLANHTMKEYQYIKYRKKFIRIISNAQSKQETAERIAITCQN